MPILILSLIVQIALVAHVVRTGRNMSWVFVLIFAPVIGGIAYFIVEILPEMRGTRTARKVQRQITATIDPHREFREAAERYEETNTVQNAIALAAQHMRRSEFGEAKTLYQRALTGVHATDPDVLYGLASAQFGLREYDAALRSLDTLKADNPDRTNAEGHLLYARALQELCRTDEAIAEFEALHGYYSGPEPACRLALLLREKGDNARASELFREVVKTASRSGGHYNDLNREWVAMAKRETGG